MRHHIQYFFLKVGNSVHDQPNNKGPNMKLNNLYGNVIMNWMRNHGTLKFILTHMNSAIIETWEAFNLSYATTTQKSFKKTHLLPLSPPYKGTNRQACFAGTQMTNRDKSDYIGLISKTIISPIEME